MVAPTLHVCCLLFTMQRFASERRPSLANFVWEASLAGRWAAIDEVPGLVT